MEEQINNQLSTKKERKLLRRRQKQQEYLCSIHRRKIKKISIIVLATTLLVGGTVFSVAKLGLRGDQNSANIGGGVPKIEINPVEYDLGDISMAAGVVKKTFEVKNTGAGDLKIDSIRTSCHCTTAALKVGNRKSAKFSMGGSGFWSQNISPDQTGYLEVEFDPAYHGFQGIGRALRAVYLSTNAPAEREVEVMLIANVEP